MDYVLLDAKEQSRLGVPVPPKVNDVLKATVNVLKF